ncbi:MAG: undecaprenyl-diphosphate phosphatase [Epsilonproteobacteria bacterium]|nr:undecaprenyl-diphosphate phosphatase [Campylobacterota bacterium]
MDLVQSIIIGVVEGFTEFLPISSTGHMIVVSKFLGVAQNDLNKAFEVIIQFAAILAVVILYKDKLSLSNISLWKKILVAFAPLLIVGYIFKDQIKALFNVELVAWMFIIGGIVFLIVEYFYNEKDRKIRSLDEIGYKEALFIGIAQLFSLIPGTSRAGSTIVGGLLAKLDRRSATEFSFLLAIPVMGAVSGYDLLKHYKEFLDINWGVYLVGFFTAFVVAYFTIKLFLEFISRFNFIPFAIYRIIFGIFLLLYFN